MRVRTTAPTPPAPKFEANTWYKLASGSFLFVSGRKHGSTYVMNFYGVKNKTPHTWLNRPLTAMRTAHGDKFVKVAKGTSITLNGLTA